MSDPPSKAPTGGKTASSKTDNKGVAHPPATRYSFVADVELIELQSETAVRARTSDLSLTGCYVDFLNPFAAGAHVRLRITHRERTFEALGRVAHSQPGMGMGIAFTRIEPDQKALLEKWLAESSGESSPAPKVPEFHDTSQEASLPERHILSQLISLLVKKGILNEAEGSALLRELRR